MQHNIKDLYFERITANTFDVFYKDEYIGIAVETNETAKFYPQPKWKFPVYKGPTKTIAVGSFIIKHTK